MEAQVEPITDSSSGGAPMLDCTSLAGVSRQIWALLGPLIASDSSVQAMFRNFGRLNVLEAWRRIAEPIIDDKPRVWKDLLPLITNRG